MSLYDDLKKKLKPEDLQTVEDILGDDFEWDLVPRTRLNKVIGQRNDLKKQLKGIESQPTPIKKDDDGSDITLEEILKSKGDDVTFTEEEVNQLLKSERTKAQNAAKATEVKYATLSKLQEEKALDASLVFGLLDSSKLSLNDKGELQGLKEAGLDTLKENKSFLFGNKEDNVPPGTGKKTGGQGGKAGDAVDAAIANIFSGYGVAQNVE